MNQEERINQLKRFDTPSITNVVATYPKDPDTCLGLYHPWDANWYTDQTIKCMYPELGRVAGYAVTAVYGLPSPEGFKRLSFDDILRVIDKTPKPVIFVIKQDMPDTIKKKCGLSGGNMTTALKSLGVVGVISDGPSRDIDEIRPMGMQYLLTGLSPGHGEFEIKAINVPVSICSMDVAPGEIIHMDENGAVKFPAACLEQVTSMAEQLQKNEVAMQAAMRETHDVEEIINIMGGSYYVKK